MNQIVLDRQVSNYEVGESEAVSPMFLKCQNARPITLTKFSSKDDQPYRL